MSRKSCARCQSRSRRASGRVKLIAALPRPLPPIAQAAQRRELRVLAHHVRLRQRDIAIHHREALVAQNELQREDTSPPSRRNVTANVCRNVCGESRVREKPAARPQRRTI